MDQAQRQELALANWKLRDAIGKLARRLDRYLKRTGADLFAELGPFIGQTFMDDPGHLIGPAQRLRDMCGEVNERDTPNPRGRDDQ